MSPLIAWMPGIWELAIALVVVILVWHAKYRSNTTQAERSRHIRQAGAVAGAGMRLAGIDPRAAKPRTGTPGWYLPAGVISLIPATLGFLASAAVAGKGDLLFGLFAGLLNPLVFVGLPLGIYWLLQHAKSAQPCAPSPPTSPEESNPKLMACPDCGRHVSRLATTCPNCGRPLAADKPVD
jgi:hypothetical protein